MKSRDENKELNFIEEAARQLAGYDDASLLKEMEWAEREWELRKQTHPKEAEAEMQSADQSFRLLMERIQREAREGDAFQEDEEVRPKKITNPTDEKAAKEPEKTPNAAEETGDGSTGNLPGIMRDTRRITDDEGNASCVAKGEGSTAAMADGEGDIRCGADDESRVAVQNNRGLDPCGPDHDPCTGVNCVSGKDEEIVRDTAEARADIGSQEDGMEAYTSIESDGISDIQSIEYMENGTEVLADNMGDITGDIGKDVSQGIHIPDITSISSGNPSVMTYGVPIENTVADQSSSGNHRSMTQSEMAFRKPIPIRKKTMRRVAILTAAAMILGVGGMASVARQGYRVAEYPEQYEKKREYVVRSNVTAHFPESKIEDAYRQIADTCNIKVVALDHVPEKMIFDDFILSETVGIIKLCYNDKRIYLEEKIRDEKNTMSILTMDRKAENIINNEWLGEELYLKVNTLESGSVEYSVQFNKDSATYYLSGMMDKDEFIEIVENLYFWN